MSLITTEKTVLSHDGTYIFGVIEHVSRQSDEVRIRTWRGGTVVVSTHSLMPTATDEEFRLAYEIDLGEHAVANMPAAEPAGLKYDQEKLDWTLLPSEALDDVIRVMDYGRKKYARDNWRYVSDGYRRYLAAAYRHIAAIHRGEQIDPESGLPHAAHAVCCLMFLNYFPQPESDGPAISVNE